jgi:hypothetical protein
LHALVEVKSLPGRLAWTFHQEHATSQYYQECHLHKKSLSERLIAMISDKLPPLEEIDAINWPSDNKVQASGSSYCPSLGETGTLGVRVDRAPNNHFYYIATYHNFGMNATDYSWVYLNEGNPVQGQAGRVIARTYEYGQDRTGPILDCALIQLDTRSQNDIRRGVNKVTNRVLGVQRANVGDRVVKYGMTTGYTYGKVINRPAQYAPSYDAWLFFVQLTDSAGNPLSGAFSGAGDSGAPVLIYTGGTPGYVAGMVIQGTGNIGIISRIDQVTANLKVQVHLDP